MFLAGLGSAFVYWVAIWIEKMFG